MKRLDKQEQKALPAHRHPCYRPYKVAVILLGSSAVAYAISQVATGQVDPRWMMLAALTLLSSSFTIHIPSTDSKISISDTLFFTNCILFGNAAGILTAALDGLLGSLKSHNRNRRLEFTLFNVGAMACAAFASGRVFFGMLGRGPLVMGNPPAVPDLLLPLGALAFTHYFCNSGSVAAVIALETRRGIFRLWKESFLWTSITYFAGAAAAGFVSAAAGSSTPQVLGVIVPVVLAIYFTYRTYLDKVRQLKDLLQQVKQLAYYDSLTDLANRALFKEHLELAISSADRMRHKMAILFLDLDRFKYINDTFGHGMGDQLLKGVAARLRASVRSSDATARDNVGEITASVGRFGGDEFIVLLNRVGSVGEVSAVAERILNALAAPFQLAREEVFVSASIGISIYPDDGLTADALLKNADTAMYTVKDGGRNGFHYYSPAMNARSYSRISMENDMRRALERGEFFLEYQPKIEARTKKIIGTEALIRWRHPAKGVIPPGEFIPLAEESGLILPIGEWVLRTACEQNAAWQKSGSTPLPVAVNLSCAQFRQPDLLQGIKSVLSKSDLNPGDLELEITESTIMENVEEAGVILRALKDLGVRISIDDFGTGYSSLSSLKRFTLDVLKIDRSFIKDLLSDPDDRAITSAIIGMAHSLGLKVIAEGVDSEEQVAFLRDLGCDEVQGHLFSPPISADDMREILRHGQRTCSSLAGSEPSDDPVALEPIPA